MAYANRTRTRSCSFRLKREWPDTHWLPYDYVIHVPCEEMSDKSGPLPPIPRPWNDCDHFKVIDYGSGSDTYPAYGTYEVRTLQGWPGTQRLDSIGSWIAEIHSQNQYVPLEFQSNNSFELIPFLFDLDGTIAMFAKKFWRQISYGSVNWGILPFISDVRSLVNTVKDILDNRVEKDLAKSAYECKRSFRTGSAYGDFYGSYRMSGKVSVGLPDMSSEHMAMYILLDELGVHPDLKTLWDVIPLSFVADYFFPVGDYLESVHPRGWFNPSVTFTGGVSLTGIADVKYTPTSTVRSKVDVFSRRQSSFIGSTRPPVSPSWQAPNARELFNTAYLARSRLK